MVTLSRCNAAASSGVLYAARGSSSVRVMRPLRPRWPVMESVRTTRNAVSARPAWTSYGALASAVSTSGDLARRRGQRSAADRRLPLVAEQAAGVSRAPERQARRAPRQSPPRCFPPRGAAGLARRRTAAAGTTSVATIGTSPDQHAPHVGIHCVQLADRNAHFSFSWDQDVLDGVPGQGVVRANSPRGAQHRR